MTRDEFRKKMEATQRLADARLKKTTVESIIEQVDVSNGTGDVTIPAGQAACD
jgi:hypothetical protein